MPENHERELREQWQESHLQRHEADAKAVDQARHAIDQRLEEMNAMRAQISSERGTYVHRDFYDERHNALRDGIDTRLKILEQNWSNLQGRLWMMGIGISGVVVAVNLVLHYMGKK